MTFTIEKIISGGQTGVDRAALDFAMKFDIPHGGWCPKGRIAEDGIIPAKYQLMETDSVNYSVRTKKNIKQSNGTMILYSPPMEGGTAFTYEIAFRLGKPLLLLDLNFLPTIGAIHQWIFENRIQILNIAGSRESQRPGITLQTMEILTKFLLT